MNNELALSVTLHRVSVHAQRHLRRVVNGLQPPPCLATCLAAAEVDFDAAEPKEVLDATPRRLLPVVLHAHLGSRRVQRAGKKL